MPARDLSVEVSPAGNGVEAAPATAMDGGKAQVHRRWNRSRAQDSDGKLEEGVGTPFYAGVQPIAEGEQYVEDGSVLVRRPSRNLFPIGDDPTGSGAGLPAYVRTEPWSAPVGG